MAKEKKSRYKALGVMAGSSMDGLDVVEATFVHHDKWKFHLNRSEAFSYDSEIEQLLSTAPSLQLEEQKNADRQFGRWVAKALKQFGYEEETDLAAVHGHTILHDPQNCVSWQLGDGQIIANQTQLPAITNFRSMDVAAGGEGAPLVPQGDFELFSEYEACINLGGIANVSVRDRRIAWDVCPCNQLLNAFASKAGYEFDKGGTLASEGQFDSAWYNQIRGESYFHKQSPKSLANNYLIEYLDLVEPSVGLHTYSRFIADQIIRDLQPYLKTGDQVLVTGGGAKNDYLVGRLIENTLGIRFLVPSVQIVDFKEAIVFAFLGVLRWRDEINVLASVTGASSNSSSGDIHYPK